MYWSKYNIVFESPYGRFIYNTFTNNLMEMNASLISCIHYCPVKILDLEINRVDHHPLGR